MEVEEFQIAGPLLITPKAHADARGFFVERFKKDFFDRLLPNVNFVQDNFSLSAAGVLRGIHYQYDLPQGKLVTCLNGKIFDVAVDIRKDSKTFGQHVGKILSGDLPQWLWVPAGFAHGFCVIGNEPADVLYKVNVPYGPQGEGGIVWNDVDLKIPWPIQNPSLSPKDEVLQSFANYSKAPKF